MSMIGADGSGMAIGTGHETDRVGPGSRGRERGSVMIEFALSFPILLVLFAFAWQMLNMYNADILGTYAAFSAARSYAVFRNNAGWEGEDAANKAVHLARDVAVVAMSPVSGIAKEGDVHAFGWFAGTTVAKNLEPKEKEDDETGLFNLSKLVINEIIAKMKGFASDVMSNMVADLLFPDDPDAEDFDSDAVGPRLVARLFSSEARAVSAWGQMKDFRVVEYGPGPPKVRTITTGGDVQSFDMDDAQPYQRLSYPLTKGYLYSDVDPDPNDQIRLAQVSFTYRLPLWLGFVHMNTFRRADPAKVQEKTTFAIYQSSACAIEPGILAAEPTEGEKPENRNDEIEKLEADLKEHERGKLKPALIALRKTVRDASKWLAEELPDSHAEYAVGLPRWSNDNVIRPTKRPGVMVYGPFEHPSLRSVQHFDDFKTIYAQDERGTVGDKTGDRHRSVDESMVYWEYVLEWVTPMASWKPVGERIEPHRLIKSKEWLEADYCYRHEVIEGIGFELRRIKRVKDQVKIRNDAIKKIAELDKDLNAINRDDYADDEGNFDSARYNSDRKAIQDEIKEERKKRDDAIAEINKEHDAAGYNIEDRIADYTKIWEGRRDEQATYRINLKSRWEDIIAKRIEDVREQLTEYYLLKRKIDEITSGQLNALKGLL